MKIYDKIYIGGEWVPAGGDESFDVINASTEEVIGRVPKGTIGDAERAVERAAQAFPAWSATSVQERADFLQKLQAGLGARMNEIAEVVASEVGMPIKLSTAIQAGLPTLNMG